MASDPDDYYNRFRKVFTDDFGFSRKFKREIDKILMGNLAKIKDYEAHENEKDWLNDAQGLDRTIHFPKVDVGIRVRRDKPYYISKAEFTIDFKEWNNKEYPHYYLYGYGNEQTRKLRFYMLFDYRNFRRLVDAGKIKAVIERNKKHSSVYFKCFKLRKIFENHATVGVGGEKKLIQEILGMSIQPVRLDHF